MKRIIGIALCAALALAVLVPSPALAIGGTPAGMHPKTPLRYVPLRLLFSTTANITASAIGACPPGGAKVKDIVLSQAAAGAGGTSWSAIVKKNGTTISTAEGVIALSDGANKAVNTAAAPIAIAKPTGATRPALKTDGTASCVGGDSFTVDITLTGVYGTAVTGSVTANLEPNF
jgi:hypothetical protein